MKFMPCITFVFVILSVLGDETGGIPAAILPSIVYPPSLARGDYFNSNTGSYHYQYDTGVISPASFRAENRDPSGTVTGYFGFVDEQGVMRITHYIADENGFRSKMTIRYLHSEEPKDQQHADLPQVVVN